MAEQYAIEMLNITKRFQGIVANDNITLQLRRGEIHALLGENGAGKSTLMSVLFGLYQPEEGVIKKDGKVVSIKDPNDANALHIGMVHQHFKLVECFTVLDNIIMGVEPNKFGFLMKKEARRKVMELSERYGLHVDPDAKIEDITVGMQQRTEILKMLYRDNDILIFDEPTAMLTPGEIDELMQIMRNLAAEGKSILFISHKLAEIMAVSDRCTVLRKGRYVGTVETKDTTPQELSVMMVGRDVNFHVEKQPSQPGETVLQVRNMSVASKLHSKDAVRNVSFDVRRGEIVCIAGIDGNGQTELVYGLTGLEPISGGSISMLGKDISSAPIRRRSMGGMSHIPEDRHKHGLVLDYTLEDNMILQRYFESEFSKAGFMMPRKKRAYTERLINEYDIRSARGGSTIARSMSGGNQQKAIVAREIDKDPSLMIAVQPTRGLDVGAIENIHKQIVLPAAVMIVDPPLGNKGLRTIDKRTYPFLKIDAHFTGTHLGRTTGSSAFTHSIDPLADLIQIYSMGKHCRPCRDPVSIGLPPNGDWAEQMLKLQVDLLFHCAPPSLYYVSSLQNHKARSQWHFATAFRSSLFWKIAPRTIRKQETSSILFSGPMRLGNKIAKM